MRKGLGFNERRVGFSIARYFNSFKKVRRFHGSTEDPHRLTRHRSQCKSDGLACPLYRYANEHHDGMADHTEETVARRSPSHRTTNRPRHYCAVSSHWSSVASARRTETSRLELPLYDKDCVLSFRRRLSAFQSGASYAFRLLGPPLGHGSNRGVRVP